MVEIGISHAMVCCCLLRRLTFVARGKVKHGDELTGDGEWTREFERYCMYVCMYVVVVEWV